MNDSELRSLFPVQITRGALLRSDGVAAGLVIGGAPAWDLLASDARAQAGADYHRLLLALDAPIDLYVVDQPPDLDSEIATLRERQARVSHPLLAEVLEDIAGYLTGLAEYTGSRAKQVVWVVTSHGSAAPRGPSSRSLTTLLGRGTPAHGGPSAAQRSALALVVERARRLADSLAQLGGVPPARLMEAEEIARLLYQRADPVRAARYPLSGTLLGRVRRVVTTDERSTR